MLRITYQNVLDICQSIGRFIIDIQQIQIMGNKQKQGKISADDQQLSRYRMIKIQNLEGMTPPQFGQINQQRIINNLTNPQNKKKKPINPNQIYCFKGTSNQNSNISNYNNFFAAFLEAYNHHGNILLIPDDIWLMITIFVAKYVEQHSQKLRDQLVRHEGKKTLTVVQLAGSVKESLQLQKNWDNFFPQILKQIQKNTHEGVIDQFISDFSTTTQVYKVISVSVIMGAMKNYFDYQRIITKCGIRNVYFDGSLKDWQKILKKLICFKKYDVDGEMKKYIDHVGNIIKKFIKTYQGQVDKKWWNQIMSLQYPISGQQTVDGWILHCFGKYQRIPIGQIPSTLISVPVKLKNQWTGTQKNLEMLTNWSSISKIGRNTYKPDISLGIVYQKNDE